MFSQWWISVLSDIERRESKCCWELDSLAKENHEYEFSLMSERRERKRLGLTVCYVTGEAIREN